MKKLIYFLFFVLLFNSVSAINIFPSQSGTAQNISVFQKNFLYLSCSETWSCTAWSDCTINNNQSRTCTDSQSCGTENNKPATNQSCTYQVGGQSGGTGSGGSGSGTSRCGDGEIISRCLCGSTTYTEGFC